MNNQVSNRVRPQWHEEYLASVAAECAPESETQVEESSSYRVAKQVGTAVVLVAGSTAVGLLARKYLNSTLTSSSEFDGDTNNTLHALNLPADKGVTVGTGEKWMPNMGQLRGEFKVLNQDGPPWDCQPNTREPRFPLDGGIDYFRGYSYEEIIKRLSQGDRVGIPSHFLAMTREQEAQQNKEVGLNLIQATAAGAGIGASIGGPVGAIVGGAAGAIVGLIGAHLIVEQNEKAHGGPYHI